jgi:hypothetical protein
VLRGLKPFLMVQHIPGTFLEVEGTRNLVETW